MAGQALAGPTKSVANTLASLASSERLLYRRSVISKWPTLSFEGVSKRARTHLNASYRQS